MWHNLQDTYILNKREEQVTQYHFITQIADFEQVRCSNIQVDDDNREEEEEEEEDVIDDEDHT